MASLLEGKGARTLYVANRGLGDLLVIGRQCVGWNKRSGSTRSAASDWHRSLVEPLVEPLRLFHPCMICFRVSQTLTHKRKL